MLPAPTIELIHTEIRDTETQDRTESVSFSNHFIWGESDSECFIPAISSAYKEIVHWRRNIFMIPSGPSGKEFILEITTVLTAFVERYSLEPIALQAVMTMPALLLQKLHTRSKAKDHFHCLKLRLEVWKEGRISSRGMSNSAALTYL